MPRTSDGLAEHDQEVLVAARLVVPAQDGELTALLASLSVANDHARLGTPVGAGVVGGHVGAFDDGVVVIQSLGCRCDAGSGDATG